MIDRIAQRPGAPVLGLAFDSGRLEGVAVRRTNGSVEVKRSFAVSLSLDVLTQEPELVGREIRGHLATAGIRERTCTVAIPSSWALTVQVKLPDLPEADQESLLQMEAERGFPCAVDTLIVASSRFRAPSGETQVMLVGVPRHHVLRLQQVLKAAQLRPVSFSLGIAGLEPPENVTQGEVILLAGEAGLGLCIWGAGGLAALRFLEGAFEMDGSEKRVQTDQVVRELRITLGQLPAEVRSEIHRVRIFGEGDVSDELAEQLTPRLEGFGLPVERARHYAAGIWGVTLPAGTPISAGLGLALQRITGRSVGLEFLPPRISTWQRLRTRTSSARLVWVGATVGALALCVAAAFGFQQWQLWRWQSRWSAMSKRVTGLQDQQTLIKRYRPWYDQSLQSLNILRRLTEAFPVEGTVSAKSVNLREPATVTCIGTARDGEVLLKTFDRLRQAGDVSDLNLETRGSSPVEFTLSFQWHEVTNP